MIRRAEKRDVQYINDLLLQVELVHHAGRPDLFKNGGRKYTDSQLADIIADDNRPVFVYERDGKVVGYAFCIFRCTPDDNIMTDIKTIYIDDLCVDENHRGEGIGGELYRYVKEFAKNCGCYNVTLNVWCLNDSAMHFYEKLGLKPQKIGMEEIL